MNLQMHSSLRQDQFGRRIAARLTEGSQALGNDIDERLRVARQQALARRKAMAVAPAGAVVHSGRAAVLQWGGGESGWWGRLASALPLLVLAAGLMLIHIVQNEDRANEVAEVDTALLTDALPTAAYTDPGFVQFLKVADTVEPKD